MISINKKGSLLRKVLELRSLFWAQKQQVLCGMIILLFSRFIGLYVPMLNRRIFDNILPSKDIKNLLFLGSLMFLLGCLELASSSISSLIFSAASLKISVKLRSFIFRKLTHISYRHYEEFLKGDIYDSITFDVDKLQSLYLDKIGSFFCRAIIGSMSIFFMTMLSVHLTLICLIFICIISVVTLFLNKKIYSNARTYTENRSQLNSGMFDMLMSMPLIKMCCADKKESRRFDNLTEKSADSKFAAERTVVLISGIITTVQDLTPFAIFVIGVFLMIREQMLLGELFAFSMYFGKLRGTMESCFGAIWQWQECKPSLERLIKILDLPDEDTEDKPKIKDITKCLEVSGLTLKFGKTNVLKDISLVISPGEMVAIAGPNGSGKTTLLKVLSGLMTPDEGYVSVDGERLDKGEKKSYRHLCGFVFQNPVFLNRSIREMIGYRLEIPLNDDYLYAVLEKVGLRQFVQSLPQKLDTKVGEMGGRVSGGEMQRLSIARELAHKPRVLFLDEATASIDARGEYDIFRYLKEVCAESKMSVIFVTHYLSTLYFADIVYVINDGRLYDKGTPQQLTDNSQYFQQLFYARQDEHRRPIIEGSNFECVALSKNSDFNQPYL